MIDGNMVPIVALLIPITAILGFFTMMVFLRKYENDERMAMIAKGITPPLPQKKEKDLKSIDSLRIGFLLVGSGTGLFMGSLLTKLTNIQSEAAYFPMIFIFGGLGLLGSYFYQMNVDKKNQANKEV